MPRVQRITASHGLQATLDALMSINESRNTIRDDLLEQAGVTTERRQLAAEAAAPVLVPLDKTLLLGKYTAGLPLSNLEVQQFKEAFGVDPTAAPAPAPAAAPAALPAPAAAPAGLLPAAAAPAPAPAVQDTFKEMESITGVTLRKDQDGTTLSCQQNSTFNGVPMTLNPAGDIVSVGTASERVTPGLGLLLIAKGSVLAARSGDISKADMTSYLALADEAGVTRASVERGTSNKAKALKDLLTQKGAGVLVQGKRRRRARAAPPSTASIVGPDGSFGTHRVDLKQLGNGVLHLTDMRGKLVLHQEISDGLRHLLTKSATRAQAAAGLFLPGDVSQYRHIAKTARVPLKKTDRRVQLADEPVAFLPDDEKVLSDRLTVLDGMRGAGDSSKSLVSESAAILDRMLKRRWLSKKEHEARMRALLA